MWPNRTVKMDFYIKIPDEQTDGMVMVDKHRDGLLLLRHQPVAGVLWLLNVLIEWSVAMEHFALD